jgi:hypothetical protein
MKNGTWRGGVTPTKDPSGLTLGIVGMGAIGKVSRMGRVDAKHIPDACPVPCEESTRFQHEDQVL